MQDNFGSGSARIGSGSDWESSRFRITAIYSTALMADGLVKRLFYTRKVWVQIQGRPNITQFYKRQTVYHRQIWPCCHCIFAHCSNSMMHRYSFHAKYNTVYQSLLLKI